MAKNIPAYDELEAWLKSADLNAEVEKQAATQKVSASLPDGDAGKRPVTTGERFAENTADVKKVPGANATTAEPMTDEQKANAVPLGVGLEQGDADGLKSVSRAVEAARKAVKDASDLSTEDGIHKAAAAIVGLAADLKKIAVEAADPAKQSAPTAVSKTAAEQSQQDADAANYAAWEKAAADEVTMWAKAGEDRAVLAAAYLDGFRDVTNYLQKLASEGALEDELAADSGTPPKKEEEEEGEEKEEKGESEEKGEKSAPPAMPPELPPELMGTPPGAGGPPPGDIPPELAAAMNPLAAGMIDVGHNPQTLEQQLMAALQGGGGGAPMAAKIAKGIEVVHATRQYMASGKFEYGPPKNAAEAAQRKNARAYFAELAASTARR